MWMKVLYLLILIKLFHEHFVKHSKNEGPINPIINLQDILSKLKASIKYLYIVDGTTRATTEHVFYNISLESLHMSTDVTLIRNRAFQHSKVSLIPFNFNNNEQDNNGTLNSSKIESLNIEYNELGKISTDNVIELSNLTKSFGLFQNFTHFENLEGIFSDCLSFNYLYIENNLVTTQSDVERLPKSLVNIDASNKELKSGSLSILDTVTNIDISYNKLSINCPLDNLFSLRHLYLNYNLLVPKITIIDFSSLNSLEELRLEGNNLTQFDITSLNNLTNLKQLSLAVNNLTHLDFSQCTSHLTYLDLSRNSLIEIENISKLHELQSLNLSFNSLQRIRYNTFKNMRNLHTLDLRCNSIYTIQKGCLKGLKNLRRLNLSHNKLTNIGLGSNITGPSQLNELDLSYNNLVHFNKHVFHISTLGSLSKLDLSYNYLKSIDISDFTHDFVHQNREFVLNGNNLSCCHLPLEGSTKCSADLKLLAHDGSHNIRNRYGEHWRLVI